MLEIAFVFLILFAAFPKTPISSIIKICVVFLIFNSLCFLLQGFLPFHSEHKLFDFEINEGENTLKIITNLISLVVMHLAGCLLFASELLRGVTEQYHEEADQGSTLQYQRELNQDQDSQIFNSQQLEHLNEIRNRSSGDVEETDYKNEVSSLFDIYLNDYENNQDQVEQNLSNMETILLNNLKEGVTGVMCLDAHGKELHDPVFHWEGYNKHDLIELYKANNNLSANLNEGGLCQMLFCDNLHWYLIAKYRGNYLLLQTDDKSPDSLIENSFYLVQAIRG